MCRDETGAPGFRRGGTGFASPTVGFDPGENGWMRPGADNRADPNSDASFEPRPASQTALELEAARPIYSKSHDRPLLAGIVVKRGSCSLDRCCRGVRYRRQRQRLGRGLSRRQAGWAAAGMASKPWEQTADSKSSGACSRCRLAARALRSRQESCFHRGSAAANGRCS